MKLTLDQMKGPAEVIGHIRGGGPVYKMISKGGLAIVLSKDEGGKILGTGPHIAIAKMVAQNNEPDLVITELNKSEDFSPELFRHILPYWTNLTKKINNGI